MGRPRKTTTTPKLIGPPATTPEAREQQLVSLAVDLAEQRLLEGTATSQEIIHFLRLGSTRAELEAEKLRRETALLEAKSDAISSAQRTEELYAAAMKAMTSYQGHRVAEEEPEDDY